jgi:hypothetical protein
LPGIESQADTHDKSAADETASKAVIACFEIGAACLRRIICNMENFHAALGGNGAGALLTAETRASSYGDGLVVASRPARVHD